MVGHDCLHGTFTRHRRLATVLGHLAHAPLFLHFHGSKRVHLRHHAHTNNVDKDTQFRALQRAEYESRPSFWRPYGVDEGCVFNPWDRKLYGPSDVPSVLMSNATLVGFVLLLWYTVPGGVPQILDAWFMPAFFSNVLINWIIFLHHTFPEGVYYKGNEWSFLRAQLTTTDRSLGWMVDSLFHDGSIHVAEHLFPGSIPHYRWREATKAIRPILGDAYRWDPRPWPVALLEAFQCRYVVPRGDGFGYATKVE